MTGDGCLAHFLSDGFVTKNFPLSHNIEIPIAQKGDDVFIYYRNFDS